MSKPNLNVEAVSYTHLDVYKRQLFGIAGGYIASLIFTWCGVPMVNFQSIAEAQWVGLPNFMLPLFDWRAIAVIAPLAIVTFVEHIGDISANGAVVGQDFFKDPGLHLSLIHISEVHNET